MFCSNCCVSCSWGIKSQYILMYRIKVRKCRSWGLCGQKRRRSPSYWHLISRVNLWSVLSNPTTWSQPSDDGTARESEINMLTLPKVDHQTKNQTLREPETLRLDVRVSSLNTQSEKRPTQRSRPHPASDSRAPHLIQEYIYRTDVSFSASGAQNKHFTTYSCSATQSNVITVPVSTLYLY